MPIRPWTVLVVAAVLFLVGCDHATKYAAEKNLRDESQSVIKGAVSLELHENHGVAFNNERILPESARKPIIFGVGILAIGVLAIALYRRRGQITIETAALLFVAGGALGNLLDRLLRGYVVDFVRVEHWPVFNLADVFLVVGAALMIVGAYRHRPESPHAPETAS